MNEYNAASWSQSTWNLTFGTSSTATIAGQIVWNGGPVIDDDDGGTAGVREPRRPGPAPLAPMTMAVEVAA